MNVNHNDSNANNASHLIQSQPPLPMYDNAHGNRKRGSSPNTQQKSSPIHGTEGVSNSSPTSTSMLTASPSTGTSTATGSPPQSARKHSYTHSMTNDPNDSQDQSTNLNNPTAANINKSQFLLEQQIKLTQLHQLQQLQNHIFQQQMALISGQPASTSPEFVGIGGVGSIGAVDIPIDLNAVVGGVGGVRPRLSLHNADHNMSQSPQQSQNQRHQGYDGENHNHPLTFSGLPTPAPSGEIRPMDYNATSPPMMNLLGSLNLQYIEPLPNSMIPSSNSSTRSPSVPTSSTTLQPHSQPNSNMSQRFGHRHSTSISSSSVRLQNNHQGHASYPSSPLSFNHNSTSPTFHPISPMNLPYHPPNSHQASSHTTPHLSAAHLSQYQMQAHNSHPSSSTSTPMSAPPSASERIAFTIYGGNGNRTGGSVHATPHLHPSNSVHTSPNVLGSGVASINGAGVGRGFGHVQPLLDLDQDISPLTSPWLGATATSLGGTAAAGHASAALVQKGELLHPTAMRTSVSGNKRTASESGDEGGAWNRGGTIRNSRKRPVLGPSGRIGSFTNAAVTPGERGKRREKDDKKARGSMSPLTRSSTSPTSEVVSYPLIMSPSPAMDRGNGGVNEGSSQTPTISLVTSTGSSISRRTKGASRSTSATGTPLLRSTPSSTNLLSSIGPTSPALTGGSGGTASSRNEGRRSRVVGNGQGQEVDSPSPIDLNLEIGQDGKCGRSMLPPPLPRGGLDVDMNSTDAMDESSSHLRHGMLGMGFDAMMSLDEGMNDMVSMGMGGLGGMGGMGLGVGGLDGMGGMDMSGMGGMGSMEGIGGMSMEEMGVQMGMNMGGMGGFGNGHEHPHHQDHRREDLGIMGMEYGRDHDAEGTHISSSTSAGRTNMGNATIRPANHQQNPSQSHLAPHSEYQQPQPHLSPGQSQHNQQPLRPLSHMHPLHAHQVQTDQSPHQLQNQPGHPNPGHPNHPNPGNQPNQQQPVMPVATPSSILNLGRLGSGSGGRLGSALSASTSTGGNAASSSGGGTGMVTRAKKATKASRDAGGASNASRKKSMTTVVVGSSAGVGVSPGLKPLRPAAAPSEATLPSPALTGSMGSSALKATASTSGGAAGSTGGGTPALSPADAIGVIRQPKRTHRDAEQRRRNSQKQVIDELRRLLPPIALPSESNASNNGDSDPGPTPGTSPFFFQPTATLLPGGLPPRGPPKTGGEGPNKNVSKLQVLLCGNEYIKLLKARVERRDEEIGRLRGEVRRMRALREGGEEDIGREEEVDLEKDLDAVERLDMISSAKGASVGGSGAGGRGGGDDVMDEDDDDGDD